MEPLNVVSRTLLTMFWNSSFSNFNCFRFVIISSFFHRNTMQSETRTFKTEVLEPQKTHHGMSYNLVPTKTEMLETQSHSLS